MNIVRRLTSRKFLITVGGLAVLAANQQWTYFVIILGGYLGINQLGSLQNNK